MTKAIGDVDVEISVVLGKAVMPIHQLLKMGRGAVIELDTAIEEPAFLYANNKLVARGQVMIVNENLAISITETITGDNG
jgi:flagellar motor switch protein FliN/FliY